MRIERLSQDKIRFFLTFDDLSERGIEKEDMWRDIPKVNELFSEMMDQAYKELGFEVSGPVAVEVFALPAQGMVVIVTRGKTEEDANNDDHDETMDYEDEVYELQVTMEESDIAIFSFTDFEYLLQAIYRIRPLLSEGGSVYFYRGHYFVVFENVELNEKQYNGMIAILSEYGEASTVTLAVLEEYGKKVIKENAMVILLNHFNKGN